MVRPIPLGRPTIFPHLIADILDAAEDGKYLAARATVLGAELAGKALGVSEAPVDDQPGELSRIKLPSRIPGHQCSVGGGNRNNVFDFPATVDEKRG